MHHWRPPPQRSGNTQLHGLAPLLILVIPGTNPTWARKTESAESDPVADPADAPVANAPPPLLASGVVPACAPAGLSAGLGAGLSAGMPAALSGSTSRSVIGCSAAFADAPGRQRCGRRSGAVSTSTPWRPSSLGACTLRGAKSKERGTKGVGQR